MAQQDKTMNRGDKESSQRNSSFFSRLFCQHDWAKREAWHQPPRAEKKTAWKCSECGKVIKKFTWQTPD